MAENAEYQRGVADERERIAKFLETHDIDWDCSVLGYDESDYDAHYCEFGPSDPDGYDEFKSSACQRRVLADVVRGKITVT